MAISRHKVSEPIWSSHAGKENNTDARVTHEVDMERKRYTITNEDHAPSDCYNCQRGINGVCIVARKGQPKKTLEHCNATYGACQFWMKRD